MSKKEDLILEALELVLWGMLHTQMRQMPKGTADDKFRLWVAKYKKVNRKLINDKEEKAID